jgi:DNA-binding GntR family transcriptional regulator
MPVEVEALGVGEETAVLSLSRLFFADGQPAILAQNAIPADLFPEPLDSYDGNLPIHTFLRTYCGQEIAYAIYDIQATLPEATVGQILGKPLSQPLLKLTVTFYSRENRPLAWGQSHYDDVRLRLRLVQAWG